MSAKTQFDLHPDAEILNGFIEQALPDAEHGQVVSHLATCARCRQIVFLAQDAAILHESEMPVPAPKRPPARELHWFYRWRLAWATAGLALASLAVVVVYVRSHSATQPQEMARSGPPSSSTDALTPELPRQRAVTSASAPVSAQARMGEKAVVPSKAAAIGGAGMGFAPPAHMSAGAAGKSYSSSTTSGDVVAAGKAAPAILIQPATTDSILKAYNDQPPVRSDYRSVPAAPPAVTVPPSSGIHGTQVQGVQAQIALAPQQEPEQDRQSQQTPQTSSAAYSAPAAPASPAATETVEVSAANADLQVENKNKSTLSIGGSGALGGFKRKSAQAPLPSGMPQASTTSAGTVVLAIDKTGALFLSSDAGKTWLPVLQQWDGKAVRVRTVHSELDRKAAENQDANQVARGNSVALGPAIVFEIVNEKGNVWTSADGKSWVPR